MSPPASTARPTSKWAPEAVPRIALGTAYKGSPDFVVLAEEQREALFALATSRRVRLDGPPGSGKSLVAAYLALARAMEGERVLYMCPRKPLAAWMKWNLDCYGVCVRTINGHLAEVLGTTRQREVERYSVDDSDYFMAAREAVKPGSYELVVVDEWQATTPEEQGFIRVVAGEGRLVAVLDSSRALLAAPALEGETMLDLRLEQRHRHVPCEPELLEVLATTSKAGGDHTVHPAEGVAVTCVASRTALGHVIQREIEFLLASGFAPDQVGIVSCLTRADSRALNWATRRLRPRASHLGEVAGSSGLLADSWAYWLGLERQAILVVECAQSPPVQSIRLRNAMSRATKAIRAVVITDG